MASTTPKRDTPQIKLISLNVKGLNTPEKRSQLLLSMQRNKADIMFLQETHFHTDSTPKLRNHYFPTAYHSTNLLSKSKGVSILLAKHCPFQLIDTMTDEKGIFIFLKGSYMGRRLRLANIYAQNSRQVTFFRDITKSLTTFQEGT